MNALKSLFVVLLMSVIGMLLSSVALAAPPTISVSGIPANVVAGSSFKVTVVSVNSTAGQTINTVSFVNSQSWGVSPSNSQTCAAGSASCVTDFVVSVPSSAAVGQSSVLTAQATANTGEVATSTSTVSVSGAASTGNRPPVRIDAVEVDGFEISTSETNVRDLERGEKFTLKVKMTATASASNVEIRAFVSGFEFSHSEPISDSTSPFDVEAGVSYVKALTMKLPERADEDKYRIRVVVAGRDTDDLTMNYRIKISPTDHEVVIRDLVVTPEEVQPGRAVLATVRIKNFGDSREDDVTIRVSIPELGVSAAPDFIDQLESDESATSEEFFLRIDPCAKPGTYDVKADVVFEEGDKVVTARKTLTVVPGGACQARPSVSGGDVIVSGSEPQAFNAGSSGSYSVSVTNRGASTKVYSLSAAGADGWATVKFSPGSMVTVKPGDTQIVTAVVTANGDAKGANSFTVRVKDQGGDVVKELPLVANVTGKEGVDVTGLVQLLQWGLIALIVVLVVVGLVVAFRRMKGPREGEEGAQTYY